jgi:hypothetical protein
MTEPGRVVITKTTNTGDILYKASFARPAASIGKEVAMRISTMHVKDGFVYFEWVSFESGGYDWHVKHLSKFRFQEPSSMSAGISSGKSQ